jgi:RNA-binding protein
MQLTERQKKHLRREAHSLKPVVSAGDKGISPAVLGEIERALEHHELIKISVRIGDRDARNAAIAKMVDTTGATLVSRVGNIAAIYRPRNENPGIVLPKAGK